MLNHKTNLKYRLMLQYESLSIYYYVFNIKIMLNHKKNLENKLM